MAKKGKKGKKSKISKVKQSNQKRNKLTKQGKLKNRRHTVACSLKPKHPTAQLHPNVEAEDEESDGGEDMLGMVEADDLTYLKESITNRSYSILKQIRFKGTDERHRTKKRHVEENLEDKYEGTVDEPGVKRTKHLLPIKTKQGVVRRSMEEDTKEEVYVAVPRKEVARGSDEEGDFEVMEDPGYGMDPSRAVSTAELFACRQDVLTQRKLLIGVLASGLLETPELKVANLQRLLNLLDEPNLEVRITVRKLAAVSLLEVFKDILPSYQIKHHETNVRLKKVTLQLQNYEKNLLQGYKSYLQKMEKMTSVLRRKRGDSRITNQQEMGLGELSVRCLCELLTTHPYFNLSGNLAQLLVPFLDHHRLPVRETCANCFKAVFRGDKRGELSLHVVRRINHLVKSRDHAVHKEVLDVLLALRIRDVNLDHEKEVEMKQRKFLTREQKVLQMSKNERKRSKQLEALERELMETKAEENKSTKQHLLTEITKVVFTVYFRVLKTAPTTTILGVALEGLAKFAHCINVDFYHDLVNSMDRLMTNSTLGLREQLLCIQSVFTILSGQGDVLNIDPSRFYSHLYRNLPLLNTGRNHVNVPIALKALDAILVKRRKKISLQRLLAFTKRLGTLALQLLHNGSLSCLALIRNVMQMSKVVDVLLDTDASLGQGLYFPELEEPEYCNASNSALWELLLLKRHYHPTVRKFAQNVVQGVPATGEGSLPAELSKLSSEQLFVQFDPTEVAFNPAIPLLRGVKPKAKFYGTYHLQSEQLESYMEEVMNRETEGDIDFCAGFSSEHVVKDEDSIL